MLSFLHQFFSTYYVRTATSCLKISNIQTYNIVIYACSEASSKFKLNLESCANFFQAWFFYIQSSHVLFNTIASKHPMEILGVLI